MKLSEFVELPIIQRDKLVMKHVFGKTDKQVSHRVVLKYTESWEFIDKILYRMEDLGFYWRIYWDGISRDVKFTKMDDVNVTGHAPWWWPLPAQVATAALVVLGVVEAREQGKYYYKW